MTSNYFFIFFALVITWTCLIETTFGASGWCYQCDSRNPHCQLDVNTVGLAHDKTPCNGQCYTRIKEGLLSRGCSWEHGFMARQTSYTPVFEKDSMWIFCDTSLCNSNANVG